MNTEFRASNNTILRGLFGLVTFINMALTMMGKPIIPIDNELVVNGITIIAAAIAWGAGYWYNNSFTQAAIAGDQIKDRLKVTGFVGAREEDDV